MIRFAVGCAVFLAVGLLAGGTLVGQAPSPHAGPPMPRVSETLPTEPIPVRLELQLIDRTAMFESSPQHGAGAEPRALDHLLSGAEVEVRSFTPDAEEAITRGRSDAEGRVILDLGLRRLGSPYQVSATAVDGRRYLAKEQQMAPAGGQLPLYRVTDDHSTLQQAVIRIVTLAPGQDSEGESAMVQVRQIVQYQNGGFEVFTGPPDEPGVGFLFPVPEGAVVLQLMIGTEAALELEARQVSHWGYGVPLTQPVFPVENGLLMGIYHQEVVRGELFDLGLEAIVDTQVLQLSIEQGVFTHDADTASAWDVPPLVSGGTREMPDVQKTVNMFSSPRIPAHGKVRVPVRFGPPGISSQTIVMTLIILVAFALPIWGGIAIARQRASTSGREARVAQLHGLRERGELTEDDLERELSRLGANRSTHLERLDEIIENSDESPQTLMLQVKEIARIVRSELNGTKR